MFGIDGVFSVGDKKSLEIERELIKLFVEKRGVNYEKQ
jgi:hypothetical protein